MSTPCPSGPSDAPGTAPRRCPARAGCWPPGSAARTTASRSRASTPSSPAPTTRDSLFYECGAQVLADLHRTLADEPVSLMLTDADGLVLNRLSGDPCLLRALDAVHLAPGFAYAERDAGTNGLGLALADRVPTLVRAERALLGEPVLVHLRGRPRPRPAHRPGRGCGEPDHVVATPRPTCCWRSRSRRPATPRPHARPGRWAAAAPDPAGAGVPRGTATAGARVRFAGGPVAAWTARCRTPSSRWARAGSSPRSVSRAPVGRPCWPRRSARLRRATGSCRRARRRHATWRPGCRCGPPSSPRPHRRRRARRRHPAAVGAAQPA